MAAAAAVASEDAIGQLRSLMDDIEEPLKRSFENVHQGNPTNVLIRFLKAREYDVSKAHTMLEESLRWRVENDIDNILARPIVPSELYRAVRDSQPIGLSGFTREGHPVFAIGAGLSTLDKASDHYYVQSHIQINEYRDRVILPTAAKKYGIQSSTCVKVLDMTGLRLSALNQIKLLTTMSTIDALNYPEKTMTYYIVNVPYIFSACWKVVKPLLQERTRKKIQVLQGSGRDELLTIMDYASLPHFCKREGSSRRSNDGTDNCYSLDHPFHQQLYSHTKQNHMNLESDELIKHGSVHVEVPESDTEKLFIAKTIESEMRKIANQNERTASLTGIEVNGH
uniref:CRAL-TRIO domain-containing protein n=1 Tax=Kalanchoe fedtschenkoi TaxID=63787 RepID=A0A7N0UW90_KALFE